MTSTMFTTEMLRQVSDIPATKLSNIYAIGVTERGSRAVSLGMIGKRSHFAPSVPTFAAEIVFDAESVIPDTATATATGAESVTYSRLPQLGWVPSHLVPAYLAWLKRDRARTASARMAEQEFARIRQQRDCTVYRGTLAGPLTVTKASAK